MCLRAISRADTERMSVARFASGGGDASVRGASRTGDVGGGAAAGSEEPSNSAMRDAFTLRTKSNMSL